MIGGACFTFLFDIFAFTICPYCCSSTTIDERLGIHSGIFKSGSLSDYESDASGDIRRQTLVEQNLD